ncbi:hypothetical protein BDR07DRAFT_1402863, partial [Suillus spraguei]
MRATIIYTRLVHATACYKFLSLLPQLSHSTKMPSYLRIKISIKVIFKNLNLPKGFAVRLRRPAKNASDMAQTFLPSVQGFAGAIPIAGPPMQAAISGLLSILQVIDRRSQNKANLDRLTSRLCRLSSHLCNAPTAQDPIEQCRRDSIIRGAIAFRMAARILDIDGGVLLAVAQDQHLMG